MPDTLVIVLDPGHGGSNEGLKHQGLVEKDMNNVVANTMKDTLLQYDQVEVYITNPDKADMSLEQRAEYAKSVGADLVISLHFNMSEEHEMYGSEVWIPSTGLGYSRMHALGDIFMDQFREMGMTLRGVKTRLNDKGTDYYGIIRQSALRNIPCILVEHGYADHAMDFEKVNEEEDWKAMGVSDATAVAKFFGLKSSSLGTNYSDYVQNGYFAPETAIGSDTTEPQSACIKWEGNQTFRIGATEEESNLVYYSYSLDGKETWSEIYPFLENQLQMEIEIPDVVAGNQVCARIYNGHFLYAETETLSFQSVEELLANGELTKQQLEDALYYPEAENVEEASKSEQGSAIEDKGSSIDENRFKDEALMKQDMQKDGTALVGQAENRTTTMTSMLPAYLVSSLILLFAVLLFVAAYFTQKARRYRYMQETEMKERAIRRRKMIRVERRCLIAGMSLAILSVLCFAFTITKSVNITKEASHSIQTQNQMDASLVTVSGNSQHLVEQETEDAKKQEENPEPMIDYSLLPLVLTKASDSVQKDARFYDPEQVEYTTVYDIAEGYMRVPLLSQVPKNPYQLNGFSGSNLGMTYQASDGISPMIGIDVSKFQGNINWEQVSQAGVQFAILRMGVRGYGSGELVLDDKFYVNQAAASEMGIRTGLYFFSQAITEEEAVEEANFVLSSIEGLQINMPIVFDTEPITYDEARTDNLTPNQLTNITKAFCDTIKQAGYQPMIYANAKRFTTVLHLEQLTEYPFWLADYRQAPDYPYAFSMWQFTEKGQVPGIEGNVDIDLYFGQ